MLERRFTRLPQANCLQPRKNPTQRSFAIRKTLISFAIASLFQPGLALAADTTLPEVQVTAQSQAESGITIDAETLERKAARDVRDVFQDELGVNVGGGGMTSAQKVYVRGIEDTTLGKTLDGASQGGNVFHHQGRMLVDPDLIKSVEIDKGAALPSSGPGALAGAIRMTTKDAGDLLEAGEKVGGILSGEYSSNKGWKAGATAYAKPVEAFDFLVSGSRQEKENYKDGSGHEYTNTASTQDSLLAKLNWRPFDGHNLSLGYNTLQDEGARFLRNNMTIFARSLAPMEQELGQDNFTATYRYDGSAGGPAAEVVGYRNQTTNWRTNNGAFAMTGSPDDWHWGEEVEGRGVNAKLTSKIGDAEIRYGLNYQNQEARTLNAYKLTSASGREEADVKGVFVEGTVPLWQRLALTAGTRFDHYSYDDSMGQSFSSSGFSPSARLNWQATDALGFYTGASRTVRGVGLMESFMLHLGSARPNASDLKEETAHNIELGFNYASGPFSLKGSVFHLTIDDYIDINSSSVRDNLGKVVSKGYELSGAWQSGPFRISAGVAHSKPKLNGRALSDGDMNLGVATGRTWSAGLSYSPTAQIELGWNSRFVESVAYTVANSNNVQGAKAGYGIHDLYANWDPQGKKGPRLTLSIRNLFDKYYYDQSSFYASGTTSTVLGYAEPGRELRLQASWKF